MRNREVITGPAAGAALESYARVKVVAGTGLVQLAGATDIELGTVEDAVALGERPSIIPSSSYKSQRMVGDGVIAKYAKLYGSANGRVGTTVNANPIGQALEDCTGAGGYLEVLRGAFTVT